MENENDFHLGIVQAYYHLGKFDNLQAFCGEELTNFMVENLFWKLGNNERYGFKVQL